LTLRVRVTPEAQADLADARDWYETASAGLGADFLDEVEATLRSAAEWPNAAPVVEGPMRRALVTRFPYGVFYAVESDELVVLGCVHVRRHPRVWKSRRPT
jgi:plasmid stabilization system protein ParE